MVGTAAIVLMLSLGLAQNAHFVELMEGMEADLTMISVNPVMTWMSIDQDGNVTSDAEALLDDEMFERFSNIPGVQVASPRMRGSVFLRSGRYTMDSWNVVGMHLEALYLMDYELEWGRLLEDGDGYAALFGAFAEGNFRAPIAPGQPWRWVDRAWDLFSGQEDVETLVDIRNDRIDMSHDNRLTWMAPTDAEVEIDEDTFRPVQTNQLTIVGQLAPTGDWNIDTGIIFDINLMHTLNERATSSRQEQNQEAGHFSGMRGGRIERVTYDQGFVRAVDMNQTSRIAREIMDMGFFANYPGQRITELREQQQGLQTMLAAIAAVSLFVAALGIANTMIMAVYERTREIGIMKVIGAAVNDVRRLFLLEAALIGFIGGLFGIGLSLIGSYVLNNTDINLMGSGAVDMWGQPIGGDTTSLITLWLCGAALAFATIIGLLSGYFPARRATKLSALAAIRTE